MVDFGTVLSIAQTLLSILDRPEVKEMWSIFGYKEELENLRMTMMTVKAVLLDAEAKQESLSNEEQLYIEQLKDGVYDADDLLDEFVTLAKQKQQMLGGKFSKKVRLFFSRYNQMGVAYNMSREVKRIRNKLDSIANSHKQFGFSVDYQPIRRRREETCSYVFANDIIGREKDVEMILDMLKLGDGCSSAERDNNVPLFLTIVGMGGLGKTTLAQLVYNDSRIINTFDLRLWACVSDQDQDQLNLTEILGKILESITGKKPDTSTLDQVQRQLRRELQVKKYLLVLDDIWTENREQWLKLEQFFKESKRGSRVLVTTRSRDTATIVGNGLKYELQGLSNDHSWHLFKKKAFQEAAEQASPPSDLVEIGQAIVKQCANVPLAIRAVASLLYGQGKTKWDLVLKMGLVNLRHDKNGIIPILKLSYHHLESSLKSCFSYCALFPKDFEIDKEMLINLWIAQGYVVPLVEGQNVEDAAEDYFMILWRRCFFQDVRKDRYGEIASCKIHDLMHDVAQEVSANDICCEANSNSVVGERVRHLSVVGHEFMVNFSMKSHIRTYIHVRKNQSMSQLPRGNLFASCMHLRTLDLSYSNVESLSDSMGGLLHLRYLDLSDNESLEVLPKSIVKLHNLQSLNLKGCRKLKELPKDLSRLLQLSVLNITACEGLSCLPSGMGRLIHLHTLGRFMVGHPNSYSSVERCFDQLEDLGALNNLKGSLKLEIRVPENAKYATEVLRDRQGAYLRRKENLKDIGIFIDHKVTHMEVDAVVALLEEFQPHSNVRNLGLVGYWGDCMPSWARDDYLATFLPNLVNLTLTRCGVRHLAGMRNLHHLKTLVLESLHDLKYIENDPVAVEPATNGESSPLCCLKGITFEDLPKLEGWWPVSWASADDDADNNNSQSQQSHPYSSVSFPCFHRLDYLIVKKCPNFKLIGYRGDSMSTWAREDNLATLLPNLVVLHLTKCGVRDLSGLGNLHNLKYLSLGSLHDLKYIESNNYPNAPEPGSSGEGFSFLPWLEKMEFQDLPRLEGWWPVPRASADDDTNNRRQTYPSSLFLPCLNRLAYLYVNKCPGMRLFPRCPNIAYLHIRDFEKTLSVRSKGYYKAFTSNVKSLILGGVFLRLESLTIEDDNDVSELSEAEEVFKCSSSSLKNLRLFNCPNLRSVGGGFEHLTSLECLRIVNCPNLLSNFDDEGEEEEDDDDDDDEKQWKAVGDSLSKLVLKGVHKLKNLPKGMRYLTALECLVIEECEELQSLPKWMTKLTCLRKLFISGCSVTLLERCRNPTGENWPYIQHIPDIHINR